MISSLFARGASVSIKNTRTPRKHRCDSQNSENFIYVSFVRHITNERDHELLEAGIRVAALKGSKVRDVNLGHFLVAAVCWNGRFTRCAAVLESEQMQHWSCCARMQRKVNTSGMGSNRSSDASRQYCYPILRIKRRSADFPDLHCKRSRVRLRSSGYR